MIQLAATTEGLALIFRGIACLKETFGNREFAIDGRLVGVTLCRRIIPHRSLVPPKHSPFLRS
jgi:hypothetical protein